MSRPIDLIRAVIAGDAVEARRLADESPKALRAFVAREAATGGPPPEHAYDAETWLVLHFAADAGRAAIVAMLIDDYGVAVDSRTRYRLPTRARQTALHLAAARGDLATLDALLDRDAEGEVRDARGSTPLAVAAAAGHADAARRLLDAGVNPDPVDEQSRTPLHLALAGAAGGEDDAGAGVDATSHADGDIVRRVAVAGALLDAGADAGAVCPRDAAGFTPLHRCAAGGPAWIELVRRLLDAGADRAAADPRFGRTAHDLAAASRGGDDSAGWGELLEALRP